MSFFSLLCADMAGTTVSDDGIVEQAAATALTECGLAADSDEHAAGMDHVRKTMGASKIEVFRAILSDEKLAQQANLEFERAIADLAAGGKITAIPGAEDALQLLRDKDIKVTLTTGFSAGTQRAILRSLGWLELVNLAVTPGNGLRGRPHPDMVLHAALSLSVDNVRQIAVVGDSVNDILSGLNAGAGLVAGVTTGAHSGQALREAGATHVLSSITELPLLLLA